MTTFDPTTMRPLIEPLSPTAIIALHQASAERPCWTCPIEAHGGLGSIWTLCERAGPFAQNVTLPVEAGTILDAACAVASSKGYVVAGWDLSTFLGVRAWLVIDTRSGRESLCYTQTGLELPTVSSRPDRIEIALLVLAQADQLERASISDLPHGALREL